MKVLQLLQFIIIFLVLFFTKSYNMSAQNLNSPIYMYSNYDKKEIGIFINTGQSYTNGKLFANCTNCIFDKPIGGNYDIGISFLHSFTEEMAYSFITGYKYSSLSSSFIEMETVKIDQYNEYIDIDFRNIGSLQMNNIFIELNFRYIPFKKIYFETGLSIFFIANSEFSHEKELLTKTATLSNGEIVKLYINPLVGLSTQKSVNNKVIVQKSNEYPKLTAPIFIYLAGGYDFITREKWILSAKTQFMFALTPTSNYIKTLNINYWQIGLEFRYKISEKTGGSYED